MVIATDFDGTIVTHEYPRIGTEIPFATETLRMLIQENNRIILWTVREGDLLKEAIDWCRERGVEFYAVNKDYPEENVENTINGFSRKIKADVFIDDRNLGGIPDWGTIYQMVHERRVHRPWTEDDSDRVIRHSRKEKKPGFFDHFFKNQRKY